MPFKFMHRTLIMVSAIMLFTQCDVIKDLMTEPTGSKSTSSGTTKPPSSREQRLNDREVQLREDIVSYAKKQLGKRYKYAGRTPKQGFDCSGFTYYVMSNFDIRLSPSSREQENEGRPVDVSNAKTGDLIFFRRSKKGAVFHVALVVSNTKEGLTVIHSTSRGVVVDNISRSSYWKPKISTARDVVSG
ncbi:MAG: C40 family peptidase [Saprospiraceae bacterium]|nr:C40 family peptidase [Lewinella sp.]